MSLNLEEWAKDVGEKVETAIRAVLDQAVANECEMCARRVEAMALAYNHFGSRKIMFALEEAAAAIRSRNKFSGKDR